MDNGALMFNNAWGYSPYQSQESMKENSQICEFVVKQQ